MCPTENYRKPNGIFVKHNEKFGINNPGQDGLIMTSET